MPPKNVPPFVRSGSQATRPDESSSEEEDIRTDDWTAADLDLNRGTKFAVDPFKNDIKDAITEIRCCLMGNEEELSGRQKEFILEMNRYLTSWKKNLSPLMNSNSTTVKVAVHQDCLTLQLHLAKLLLSRHAVVRTSFRSNQVDVAVTSASSAINRIHSIANRGSDLPTYELRVIMQECLVTARMTLLVYALVYSLTYNEFARIVNLLKLAPFEEGFNVALDDMLKAVERLMDGLNNGKKGDDLKSLYQGATWVIDAIRAEGWGAVIESKLEIVELRKRSS